MRIVYLGSGEFGINCLDALKNSQHELAFIVTQPPQPSGRGRQQRPTPVSYWAQVNLIPYIEAENTNAPSIIEQVEDYKPDLIIVIAFGQKIGRELINLPELGAINVHASLLPKYRGAAPINWAIINREAKTGNSIITLADKMDAGQVLSQCEIRIMHDDTAGSLGEKLAGLAAPLLLETVEKISIGTVIYTDQNDSEATFAPKLSKSHGYLDFNESAESLEAKIRGFWPWPGASANYTSLKTGKSTRVTLAMAEVVNINNPAGLAPGMLDENLNVICSQNALRITRIKPSGSALMDFKSFTNGRQTQPGDKFEMIQK